MEYTPIVEEHDLNDALQRLRDVLKIVDYGKARRHEEHRFSAKYVTWTKDRKVVQLRSTEVGKNWFAIAVRAIGSEHSPSGVMGLFVKDKYGTRYVTHTGQFGGRDRKVREKFRARTRPDRWIDVDVEGDRDRFVVTQIDRISDADILKNIGSFVAYKEGRSDATNREHAMPLDSTLSQPPLNQILYGPPGTGKTYRTARYCVDICDGDNEMSDDEIRRRYRDLTKECRVSFVTFHQSYGYEEFVEGLRPAPSKDGRGIRLKPTRGVLKRIADRARRHHEYCRPFHRPDRHCPAAPVRVRGNGT